MGNSSAKLEAFHKAVMEDNTETVRELLQDDDVDPNARGQDQLTALQLAIAHGSLKTVELLITSTRVDLYPLTPEKETALILASARGHEDIGLHLLKNLPEHNQGIASVDTHGFQVLHHACSKGLEKMATQILSRGVSVDVLGGKLNQTPLMLAAGNGQESTVKFLLECGANKTAVDLAKMTPLHHACMANADSCVRVLLDGSNVSVHAKDISGCTPLIYCLNNKNTSLEKTLADKIYMGSTWEVHGKSASEQLLVSHGACLTDALDAGFSTFCYHTLEKT